MQLLPISIQARWLRLIALFLTAPLMSCAQLPIERLGFTPSRAREDLGYLIAAVTTNGTTPLHAAAKRNTHTKVVCALLRAGAHVDAVDNRGMRPIDHARASNRTRVTDCLANWREEA